MAARRPPRFVLWLIHLNLLHQVPEWKFAFLSVCLVHECAEDSEMYRATRSALFVSFLYCPSLPTARSSRKKCVFPADMCTLQVTVVQYTSTVRYCSATCEAHAHTVVPRARCTTSTTNKHSWEYCSRNWYLPRTFLREGLGPPTSESVPSLG